MKVKIKEEQDVRKSKRVKDKSKAGTENISSASQNSKEGVNIKTIKLNGTNQLRREQNLHVQAVMMIHN